MLDIKTIDFTKCWWTFPRPGVQHRCFQGSQYSTVTWNRLYPGHEILVHTHDFEQVVYIMSGEAKVVVDGEHVPMPKNSIMLIKPGAEHAVVAKGKEPMEYINVFGAKREDREQTQVMPGLVTPVSNRLYF